LADWLEFAPFIDVDDALGVGQTRLITTWGLVERTSSWSTDLLGANWQRLTFPQRPQFDPNVLPSVDFGRHDLGDEVVLERDTTWGDRPRFDWTFRQGDYSDTYSEGLFRVHSNAGVGIDLGFAFLGSNGFSFNDNRKKRILTVSSFGPIRPSLSWHAQFDQFTDGTTILVPSPYADPAFVPPTREDLLWRLQGELGHMADSVADWTLNASVQSGHQRLKNGSYRLNAKDRLWQLAGTGDWRGWLLDAKAGLAHFDIDSTNADRWQAQARAARSWRLNRSWLGSIRLSLDGDGDNSAGLSAVAALTPDSAAPWWQPGVRAATERVAPSLIDLDYPKRTMPLILNQVPITYVEEGDPDLPVQWENSLSLHWNGGGDSTGHWALTAHTAYVSDYTTWDQGYDSLVNSNYVYAPRARDVRVFGGAIHGDHHLFWKLFLFADYAAKYAADLHNEKLAGYYPHKGSLMASLIAPQWGYGVDVRLNATGLWWYGDKRIVPTDYTTNHVFRVDLSGSARIKGMTLYALVQNVAGYRYRTSAGYPFTTRMVRFGFNILLLD